LLLFFTAPNSIQQVCCGVHLAQQYRLNIATCNCIAESNHTESWSVFSADAFFSRQNASNWWK